jgi:hypothetical protein
MVTIDAEAQEYLRKEIKDNQVVRVYFGGFGWGGPSLGLALDEPRAGDESFESSDLPVVMDPFTSGLVKKSGGLNIKYTVFGPTAELEGKAAGCCGWGGMHAHLRIQMHEVWQRVWTLGVQLGIRWGCVPSMRRIGNPQDAFGVRIIRTGQRYRRLMRFSLRRPFLTTLGEYTAGCGEDTDRSGAILGPPNVHMSKKSVIDHVSERKNQPRSHQDTKGDDPGCRINWIGFWSLGDFVVWF